MRLRVTDARDVADRLGQAPDVSRLRMRDDSLATSSRPSTGGRSRLRSDVMRPTPVTNSIRDEVVHASAAVEPSLWANLT
jgi:hypothetical protein